MALVKDIITAAEADAILTNETDWLAQTDAEKERHIGYASTYMQQKWVCVDIDWSDDTTISDDMKEACAYYALASFNDTLYPSTEASADTQGVVVEQTDKVGSLQSTTKWDAGGGQTTYPLQYPNALMCFECEKASGAGSVKLTRV